MKDNAPVSPESKINNILLILSVFIIFDVRCVIVQKRNNTVNALDRTLRKFIAKAIFSRSPKAKREKNLPNNK